MHRFVFYRLRALIARGGIWIIGMNHRAWALTVCTIKETHSKILLPSTPYSRICMYIAIIPVHRLCIIKTLGSGSTWARGGGLQGHGSERMSPGPYFQRDLQPNTVWHSPTAIPFKCYSYLCTNLVFYRLWALIVDREGEGQFRHWLWTIERPRDLRPPTSPSRSMVL